MEMTTSTIEQAGLLEDYNIGRENIMSKYQSMINLSKSSKNFDKYLSDRNIELNNHFNITLEESIRIINKNGKSN